MTILEFRERGHEPVDADAANTRWPKDRRAAMAIFWVRHGQLMRYFLIGATASALDVALFLVLFNLVGTSAILAHSISVPVSVLFSFVTNARHNFRVSDYIALRLAAFVFVCTLGYLAGYGVIAAAAKLGIGENAGKIASLPVVFVIQYLLNSRITFRAVSAA